MDKAKKKGDKSMSKKKQDIQPRRQGVKPSVFHIHGSFDILEIEDYLQEKGVFTKPNGQVAHMDACGILVNYDSLASAIKESSYTTEQWSYAVDHWLSNPNVGPPAKIVASFIQVRLPNLKKLVTDYLERAINNARAIEQGRKYGEVEDC